SAGERRRLKPSPLVRSSTAASEISQSRSILSDSKTPIAPLRVAAAAHLAFPAMRLPASFESEVCNGGNARVKRAPPPGLSATLPTATMRSHDFADDGEAEAGPFLLFGRAAPEPLENVLSILWRHTAAAIGHFNPPSTVDRHGHFRSRRCVNDRVLNQISQ